MTGGALHPSLVTALVLVAGDTEATVGYQRGDRCLVVALIAAAVGQASMRAGEVGRAMALGAVPPRRVVVGMT